MHRLAVLRFLLLGTVLALAMNVHAQTTASPQDHGGVSVQLAGGPRALRATLGWETPVLWTHQIQDSPGRIELTGEFGVSYWGATQGREPANVWQLSAIPMLRWWPGGGRFYAEAGIGPTLFSRTQFAGRAISTAFQFGDHLGMGYQFTPAVRAGLRVSHFSNADIKQPNPGFTVLQLSWTYLY